MSGDNEPGAVIAGRYRLDHLLGEGGMGSVWAATHQLTRAAVALKFLKPEAIHNTAAVKRFMREARAASAVNHPNVIRVHDIFQLSDGAPVMVMDLLAGESLGEKLTREKQIVLPELARIMVPVLSAVGTAHAAGIVHRDLKPDNIFLAQTQSGVVPKVLDFGIAKLNPKTPEATQSAELTRTGALLGTPYYMSPEQVFGEKDVDARSDVWAMGVILYEALAGVRPVDGENLGQLLKVITLGSIKPIDELMPDLPASVRDLIRQMLVTDRDKRAQSLQPAFDTLRVFSTELAQSFSDARSFRDELFPPGISDVPSGASAAVTPNADLLGDSAPQAGPAPITANAFAHTGPGYTIVIPKRKTPAWLIGVAAIGIVGVGVMVVSLRSGSASVTAASAPETTEMLIQPEAAVSAAEVPEQTAAPSAVAGNSVADTGTDAATAHERPAAAATKGRETPGKPPKQSPSATSAVAETKPPPPAPAASLGGVATAAPF